MDPIRRLESDHLCRVVYRADRLVAVRPVQPCPLDVRTHNRILLQSAQGVEQLHRALVAAGWSVAQRRDLDDRECAVILAGQGKEGGEVPVKNVSWCPSL